VEHFGLLDSAADDHLCTTVQAWTRAMESRDVQPNQVTSWKAQLEGRGCRCVCPGGGPATGQAAVDVKSLHAKIGELTLENDFLEARSPRRDC
jgi:hypothetical protein